MLINNFLLTNENILNNNINFVNKNLLLYKYILIYKINETISVKPGMNCPLEYKK